MRRLLLIGLCAGLVASPASGGSKAASARIACGAKKMTFYFWPQGHAAVPSLRFPPYAPPHVEAYTTAGPQEAFADAAGAFSYSKRCKKVGDLPARWSGQKRTTIRTTMIVNCVFPAAGEVKASKAGGGGLLVVTVGHTTKLAVSAAMKGAGSTLTFDARYCRARAAPAQQTPTKYAFSGMTASLSLHGAPISYAFSGEMCGDPATTAWKISFTINGGNPSTRTVVLAPGTAGDAASIVFKDASGAELARAVFQLTFATGPPPTMTLTVVPTGDVTNIATSAPAAVTATSVPSC